MTLPELKKAYPDGSEDIDDEDFCWYQGPYHFCTTLYEFGKYTGFEPPKKSHLPFFKKKCVKERYEEHDFEVVTKEFLAYIIEYYTKMVQEFYKEMWKPFIGEKDYQLGEFLNSIKTDFGVKTDKHTFDFSLITPEQQTALFKMFEHIRSYYSEWNRMLPYNLENGDQCTSSWKYEYAVFELVRIYKSFDWNKNVMVYYGY